MEDDVYEIIDGKKVKFLSTTLIQNGIKGRIMFSIAKYFEGRKIGYVFGNVSVCFSEENIFIPDVVVVLRENEKILNWSSHIYGAPDMVVEVLSYSTMKKDLTIKKDTYEAQGVKEYWIIDPYGKSVSVYLLRDGKYFLDDVYILIDEERLAGLDEEEKADVKTEVPVSILEGLTVPLEFIFSWGY